MYFSLVVLTIILGIILGLSSMLISQIKMVRGMEHSVIAFYAADSGVEEALSMLQGLFSEGSLPYYGNEETIDLNGNVATYRIQIEGGHAATDGPHGDCDNEYYCIRSEGDYRGIKRAIEVGN